MHNSSDLIGAFSIIPVYEIIAVTRSGSRRAQERIETVCGVREDGTLWNMPVQEVVSGIEKRGWRFFVTVLGRPAWVVVEVSREGVKYLKTEMDGEQPYMLLKLPQCPGGQRTI